MRPSAPWIVLGNNAARRTVGWVHCACCVGKAGRTGGYRIEIAGRVVGAQVGVASRNGS